MKMMAAECLFNVDFKAGSIVMLQGDEGDMVYVVESGRYDIIISEVGLEPVASCTRGDSFGEVVLISSSSLRTATIKCVESGRLWALDRDTYQKMLKHGANLILEREAI